MTEQNTNTNTDVKEEFDPWAKAFEIQNEQKKERENAKNKPSYSFEDKVYEGLAIDKDVIFRIVGNPLEYRKNPEDAKLVLQSKMVADNGKSKPEINWKYIIENGKIKADPDWILTRLFKKVMKTSWKKYTEADIDGKTITKRPDGTIKDKKDNDAYPVDENTTTETYKRLKYNKKDSDLKSFGDASPSHRVLLNVISRMDDWCKENKHTKLLATKIGYSEKINDKGEKIINEYPDTGISKSMYDDILAYCTGIGLNPNKVDIILTRTHNNDRYSQNIFDGDGLVKLGRKPELHHIIVSGELSPEEQTYERYDLDNLFRISSYYKLKKNFSGLFKTFDAEFGENLYDELCKLVKEEEEERKVNDSDSPENNPDEINETLSQGEENNEVPFDGGTVVSSKEPAKVLTGEEARPPFWDSMDDDDRATFKKAVETYVDADNVKYFGRIATIPCGVCGRNVPTDSMSCPFCGTVY